MTTSTAVSPCDSLHRITGEPRASKDARGVRRGTARKRTYHRHLAARSTQFVEYLDPANGELTDQQARRLCEKFVPQAPGWTTKQLSDRLYRALHAIDPALRRRRYQRAVQQRGVALYLDPRTGTATLVGNGLPRTRRPPRPSGSTGWWRPPNGPGIPGGGRRSVPTCTSPCSTAPSTG